MPKIDVAAVPERKGVGYPQPDDLSTCSDIDLKSANTDGRFVHKDGSLYPQS